MVIRVGLAGDVMIGRLVNDHLISSPSFSIWGDFLPVMQLMDFNLINLETALTKSIRKVPKVFNFRSDPQNVRLLKEAKIGLVNLAKRTYQKVASRGRSFDSLHSLGT